MHRHTAPCSDAQYWSRLFIFSNRLLYSFLYHNCLDDIDSILRPIALSADAANLCWHHRTLNIAWLSTDGREWLQDRDGKHRTLASSWQPMHATPQWTARWQSRQRQALAKKHTSANASVPRKWTLWLKKRPCVDSLDSDDDWVNDCLRLPSFPCFY